MGLIYDFAKFIVGGKFNDSNVDESVKNSIRMQGKMNAITKMAKSSIMEYPVLMSEGVVGNGDDIAFAIVSYLESQYAIYTLIAMGMDPVFKGTDTRSHIATFYSEEFAALIPDHNSNHTAEISMFKGLGGRKITLEDLKEYVFSNEAGPSSGVSFGGTKTMPQGKPEEYEKIGTLNPVTGKYETTKYTTKGKFVDVEVGVSGRLAKLENKIRTSDPTIVNVEFKMAENQHVVSFPVAIKAMPRFITTEESTRVFQYLREDKPITMLVKLLSGEVGLFKDVLFQLERAKNDKELYAKLGRHPWFRTMMEKRTGRKVNGLLQLIPEVSKFIGGKETDVLPVCSLCVTKDELEEGFSNLWANIKKSDDNIMDKLMLLCLCVVDTTTNMVEFDFYGLKNNSIVRAKDLIADYGSGGGKDKGDDMAKLLQSLIYKV